MDFTNKYTITPGEVFIETIVEIIDKKEITKEIVHNKILLSNDAFAVGEIIQILIKKIEHARLSR